MKPLSAAELGQWHDLPFGETADGDGVDPDRLKAGRLGRCQAGQHASQALPPCDPLEGIFSQRVETDVEPMQARPTQVGGLLRQQQAVGRERHLLDARNGDELPHQFGDLAPYERLTPRDPDRTDAEPGRHAGHPHDLLVAEQFLPWLEGHVERHAVGAAEIAAVGDADPQVGVDAAEAVDEHGAWLGARLTVGVDLTVGMQLWMNPGAVAVGSLLALPDRCLALDPLHQPLRCGKGFAAVRGARGNGHARLADGDLAEPVDDRGRGQAVLCHRLVPQPAQHGAGQRFVGFVGEPLGDLGGEHSGSHATGRACEQHIRPSRVVRHRLEQSGRINRLPDQERRGRCGWGVGVRSVHVILR